MLDKWFGRKKKIKEVQPEPAITFGRYSDNNKPVAKVSRWTEADNFYKEKKYPESLDAFFDYLRDDPAGNLVYERNGPEGRFEFYQGSRIIRGRFDGEMLSAEVTLARMPEPSAPVMRRLLEMNFSLYYSRFALDHERLCMRFDSGIPSASPGKLYYGLKELATRADKQDDLLVQDFAALQTADTGHIETIPVAEKKVKYAFMQTWIREVLDQVAGLDTDKFSGGIAYMLLALIYRIDFLITPEGKLLHDLEKASGIYFKKDERPVTDKNRDMITELKAIQAIPEEEFFGYLFRSRHTFSIVAPQPYKAVADSIHVANQNMAWYRDNKHPSIAIQIAEYGISYCQYSYSLPKPVTELFELYMRVNYPAYFTALGFSRPLYDPAKNTFDEEVILETIRQIHARWREKYPNMDLKTANLRFDSLVNFDLSFTNELEFLNMEVK